MVEGELVDLDVCGKIIHNVVIDKVGRLYPIYGERGRPTELFPSEQVKTKTLHRLLWLNSIFRRAELDPSRMSPSLVADIVQELAGGNRQTAMDYAKTLIAIYSFFDSPHRPKIIDRKVGEE